MSTSVRNSALSFAIFSSIAICLLGIVVVLGVCYGATDIGPADILRAIHEYYTGTLTPQDNVILQLRLPRPLAAICAGAGLAIAGVLMQTVLSNPLSEPYILGISSGASLGAVTFLVGQGLWFPTLAGPLGEQLALPCSAFIGSICSLMMVITLSRSDNFQPLTMLLTGVVVSQILSSLTTFIIINNADQPQIHSVMYWLMGSLSQAEWESLPIMLGAVLVMLILAWVMRTSLDKLLLGDQMAVALGVRVSRVRITILMSVSLLVAVIVSYTGAIGFIGLIVPHICRRIVGSLHTKLIILTAIVGAELLVAVDLICRYAVHVFGQELPINVITSLLGGPLLLLLLRNRRERS